LNRFGTFIFGDGKSIPVHQELMRIQQLNERLFQINSTCRNQEYLLVHGCEEEVARQAPMGGGDGCSRVFGDLGDLLGNKAYLFSVPCALLWLPWWKKEEDGGVVGPVAAATADFAVPGAVLLWVF
jgi:hypothetical protein